MWWYSCVMLLAIIPIQRRRRPVPAAGEAPSPRPHQTPPQDPSFPDRVAHPYRAAEPWPLLWCTGMGIPIALFLVALGARIADRRAVPGPGLPGFVLLRERRAGAGCRPWLPGRLHLELRGDRRPAAGDGGPAHPVECPLDAPGITRPGALHLAAGCGPARVRAAVLAGQRRDRTRDLLDRPGCGLAALAGGRGRTHGRAARAGGPVPGPTRQLRPVHAPGHAQPVGMRAGSARRPPGLRRRRRAGRDSRSCHATTASCWASRSRWRSWRTCSRRPRASRIGWTAALLCAGGFLRRRVTLDRAPAERLRVHLTIGRVGPHPLDHRSTATCTA